jgi:hypothetical protein
MKYFFFLVFVLMMGCVDNTQDPQRIIDEAIDRAGGKKFEHSTIAFDFRNRHYITQRDGGIFSHQRIFKDSTNTVHDYLTNDGFHREVNDAPAAVPDTMAVKYTRSVNSTIYFALLPYGLNDSAVKKSFKGKTVIDDEPYYVLEITFAQEGGGEDFNDVFLYWIHEKTYRIGYMAYIYYTDGGGLRFRKALNPRMVNGVLFQDYINYKPADETVPLDQMEPMFKQGELIELSRITLENITVE